MDRVLAPLVIGLVVVFVLAIAVAWWEHRRRSAELERRLARADARREVKEALDALNSVPPDRAAMHGALEKLRHRPARPAGAGVEAAAPGVTATATAVTPSPSPSLSSKPEPEPRRLFDGPAWAETAPMENSCAAPEFADTLPAEAHFAHTLPADFLLDDAEPAQDPAGHRGNGRARRQPA